MDRYERRENGGKTYGKRQYQCSCHLLRLAKLARKRGRRSVMTVLMIPGWATPSIADSLDPSPSTAICLVSCTPSFGILQTTLEELFALCFSPVRSSSSKISASHYGMLYHTWSPIFLCLLLERTWFLFSIHNCLFSVEAPPKDGLPHVEVFTFNTSIRGHMSFDLSLLVAVEF
ncbi:hypothetical protein SADUNF_Sadunf15G0043500 [Salix dunnii]|uniref:Uncharacterized protein n=1 Tax=Salix dunnii TaxID=1413687 RepID=A0A835JFL6_9ROSI|nr:hypothetical protein SADUNF_Sadunf15G0043500 [Salix dunnii]